MSETERDDTNIFRSVTEQMYLEKRANRHAVNLSYAEKGVVFFDLDTAYIEEGVRVGRGAYIGGGTVISGDTEIGENSVIGQSCRIENSTIGKACRIDHSVILESVIGDETAIGPFAYMRPGSVVGAGCRIGDFVEIKNSVIGDGTKVSHLSYVGDADLGKDINIGCGVVFVNYDGRDKYRSAVGDGAFIGCNVNIISPVTIEGGAYIAAGSTVTRDVASGALFISRPDAHVREGWVEKRGLLSEREDKIHESLQ